MKSLHVCHIIEGCFGGTATHFQHIAELLPAKNIKLSFIVGRKRCKDLRLVLGENFQEQYRVYQVDMNRSISPFSDPFAFVKIKKILSELQPDIVHTHCSKAGVLGRIAARLLKIPAIHTPHVFAMEWAGDGFRFWFYSLIEKRVSAFTESVVTLNPGQESLCREILKMPESKIYYLENAVNTEKFYPPDEAQRKAAKNKFGINERDVVIGIAGRLERQKGFDKFISAMRQVRRDFSRARVLVAGSGSLKGRLESAVKKYRLSDNFIFIGECEDMLSFYHALDLFTLTSLWEGMPYVILEAQACALPVIACSCSGTLSLINPGVTGKLVQADNIDSLAGALCSYLKDKDLRISTGKKALEGIKENHNILDWADKLSRLYRDIEKV